MSLYFHRWFVRGTCLKRLQGLANTCARWKEGNYLVEKRHNVLRWKGQRVCFQLTGGIGILGRRLMFVPAWRIKRMNVVCKDVNVMFSCMNRLSLTYKCSAALIIRCRNINRCLRCTVPFIFQFDKSLHTTRSHTCRLLYFGWKDVGNYVLWWQSTS